MVLQGSFGGCNGRGGASKPCVLSAVLCVCSAATFTEQCNVCAYFGCRETHVAAGVLYYALTTGAGLQTLGEEYCDLLQITGPAAGHVWPGVRAQHVMAMPSSHMRLRHFASLYTGGMPMEPSAARRAVLVALQSLAPYCMARWAPAVPDREDSGSWRNDSPTEMTNAATGPEGAGQLPPLPHQRLWQQVSTSCMGRAAGMPLLTRKVWKRSAAAAACNLQAIPVQVSSHAAEAWRWLGCYSGEAARLHLALFYIYGTYYEWPKRLAGETPHFDDEGAASMIHI